MSIIVNEENNTIIIQDVGVQGPSGVGGESNTASNLGTGEGVFSSKSGVDLRFKSLIAGTNVSISSNGNEITINSVGGAGETNTASNVGTGEGVFNQKTGVNLEFKSLTAGTGISLTGNSNDVQITSTITQYTDSQAKAAAVADSITDGITDVAPSQNAVFDALAGKEPTLTKGNLTETTSSVLTITGGTNAVIGSGTTIQVAQASGSTNGYLSSADWTTFNSKQNALGYTPEDVANKDNGTLTTSSTTYPTSNAVKTAVDAKVNKAGDTLTGAIIPSVVTLTDAATIAVNATLGSQFTVTLGDNRTLGNPTGAVNGQLLLFAIRQDGGGNRTLALDTKYRLGTDITTTTLSTAAGKTDYLGVRYHSSDDRFDVISFVKGY